MMSAKTVIYTFREGISLVILFFGKHFCSTIKKDYDTWKMYNNHVL